MDRLDVASLRALRGLLETQPTTDAKIGFVWKIAAGPSLARAATLSWSNDGTLRVMARSEDWRREIVRARPVIAARVAELLGPNVIRHIKVEFTPEPPPSSGT